MSKTEKEKIVIDCAKDDLLADLEVPEMLRTYTKHYEKEQAAKAEAAKHKALKDEVGERLLNAIDAVAADTVVYTGRKTIIQATAVRGEPGTAVDEDKLRENLMKIGKLDAETISMIFAFSEVPVPAKKSSIRLTTTPREG